VVLHAPETAVSGSTARPLADGAALAGADVGLAVIVQALARARVLGVMQGPCPGAGAGVALVAVTRARPGLCACYAVRVMRS
jgi:hypothetical protein